MVEVEEHNFSEPETSENRQNLQTLSAESSPLLRKNGNKSKSTVYGATYNCMILLTGAAPTSMPFIIRDAGSLWGPLILLGVAVLNAYTIMVLVRCGHLVGVFSYQGVVESVFGRVGYYILVVLQLFYLYTTLIATNILVGDSVPKLLYYFISSQQINDEQVELYRDLVVLAVTIALTLPLSMYKNIGKLENAALVGLLSGIIILTSMSIRLGDMALPETKDSWSLIELEGTFSVIGLCAFTLVIHPAVFPIYHSLEEQSEKQWANVTFCTTAGCIVLCLITAFIGYSTFTGDILMNYCDQDTLMNISRITFSIGAIQSFPQLVVVCREVVEDVCCKSPTKLQHIMITGGIVGSIYLLSMATQCVALAGAINGIFAAIPLGYIIPPICYIKLESGCWHCWKKIPALITLGIGILVMGAGCVGLSSSSKCSQAPDMPYCSGTNSTIAMEGWVKGISSWNRNSDWAYWGRLN